MKHDFAAIIDSTFAQPFPEGVKLLSLQSKHRQTDCEGGICIPGVWCGEDGKYFGGYRTDTGSDIVAFTAPQGDAFSALRLAVEMTQFVCGV